MKRVFSKVIDTQHFGGVKMSGIGREGIALHPHRNDAHKVVYFEKCDVATVSRVAPLLARGAFFERMA